MDHRTDRREFLSQAARAAAVTATATGLLRAPRRAAASPSEQIRIALIGCGGMGSSHLRGLMDRNEPVAIVALCDVDEARRGQLVSRIAEFQSAKPRMAVDYREVLDSPDVDAVIVATPHHWHVPIALAAMQAGKDVYVEKPASHVFREGQLLIDAAARYNRVLQHGTQMRSSPVTKAAGEILDSGILGEVKVSKAWNVQARGGKPPVADGAVPAGVDYDRWLGPAPKRPFNSNRFHGNWHAYRDYGNGDIGNDGIHDLDMARWGLRAEGLPVRVTSHGSTIHMHGVEREFPDNMLVAYQYPDDKVLIYEDRLFTAYGMDGFDSGNAFYGTEGYMIFSRRGYYQVYLGTKREKGPTVPSEIRGDAGRGYTEHMQNFLACIRSRQPAEANPTVAHESCALSHLGDIAFRAGRIAFDPDTQTIIGNDEANALLTKTYREGYELPASV